MVYSSEFTKPVRGGIGSRRRRRRTAGEKGRIVEEAIAPGAVLAAVARRHDLTPQHLSNWVRAAKCGRLVLAGIGESGGLESGMAFVPVIAGEPPIAAGANSSSAAIEIAVSCCVVRVARGADAATLENVLRAVGRALS